MRFLMLMTFLTITKNAFAITGDLLTVDDIKRSTTRIQQSLHSHPMDNSIFQQKIPVGQTSFFKQTFYATLRPSLGIEIFTCVDKRALPLKKVDLNIDGAGHMGLTQFFSPKEVEETIVKPFIKYKEKTQIPTEQLTIVAEGSSAGAHRATEIALFLKQHNDTKNIDIVTLRYATGKTFDDLAVENIEKLLDKRNILEFHATGDKIAEFLDMPDVKNHLGTRIEFSASTSEAYKDRVSKKEYTSMSESLKPYVSMLDGPFAQFGLSFLGLDPKIAGFLKPDVWEIHQPITYSELAPKAFAEFKKK